MRQWRIHNDQYFAVDIIKDGEIQSTPLFVEKGKTVQVHCWDQHLGVMRKTQLEFNGRNIIAKWVELLTTVYDDKWEIPPEHFDQFHDKKQWEF